MTTKSTLTANESIYTTCEMPIKNTMYHVTVVTGKINHITVKKVTANPYRSLGKDFKDFNEAVANYKNPSIKLGLRLIEMGL